MDAKSFMGSVQLFSSRHTTLLWVIFGIVVLIGIFQVEKNGQALVNLFTMLSIDCIYTFICGMVVLVFIFI